MDSAASASALARRTALADGSWMVWTAAGIAGIWVAVIVISVFAPDMVTGSEQQHLRVAALSTWIWGLVSTGAFVWAMGKLRGNAARRPIWIGLAAATLTVWLVATILCHRVIWAGIVAAVETDPARIIDRETSAPRSGAGVSPIVSSCSSRRAARCSAWLTSASRCAIARSSAFIESCHK